MITIRIPGEPCAQGRPRAFLLKGVGVRTYDPAKSRNWKAYAGDLITQARGGPGLDVSYAAGPLHVHILAVFVCPKGDWRKAAPVPRRRHAKRGDPDNLAKAVMDAATTAGLWTDDAQVARLEVEKWIGAQGEAPYVEITVSPMEGS